MPKKTIIERVEVAAYKIPTDGRESDGTYSWESTTLVVTHLFAGGARGIGYTYADAAAATLIDKKLSGVLLGASPLAIPACWNSMLGSLRNLGESGIGLLAVSALDNALWDLKAKLLHLPLVDLLGRVHEEVPCYGSGGFTSYSIDELQKQLGGWVEQGYRHGQDEDRPGSLAGPGAGAEGAGGGGPAGGALRGRERGLRQKGGLSHGGADGGRGGLVV